MTTRPAIASALPTATKNPATVVGIPARWAHCGRRATSEVAAPMAMHMAAAVSSSGSRGAASGWRGRPG
nr:hypothetical protein [Kineosporia corallincola]